MRPWGTGLVEDEDKDLEFHGVERRMHAFILITYMGPNRRML